VSRAERGNAAELTVATLTSISEALGARLAVRVLWQGEALDRLLDAAHAGLVGEVVRLLRAAGWEVVPEATFSHFGERGSIDVLAWHPETGALLVIEVKSTVPDMGAMLAGIDRKARLAAAIAKSRGWRATSVSRLLVLPDDRTARRRLAEHAATLDAALPARTVAVRRWIRNPRGPIAGILALPSRQRTTARHRIGARGPASGAKSARSDAE
jgi:Holliday junction resolvase-like predicted endonuclease